jgi:hypothetical protein
LLLNDVGTVRQKNWGKYENVSVQLFPGDQKRNKFTTLQLSRVLREGLVLENFLYSVSHRNNKKEQKYLFLRFAKPQVETQTWFG